MQDGDKTISTDLASDLAYVRALAEEGRDTPLVNGAFYVLWGGLIGAAAFIGYLGLKGVLPGGVFIFSPYVAAFVIGWAASFWLGRRTGAKPGAMTLGNKTANAVWFAVGVFLTLFWVALLVVHGRFVNIGVPPYFLFGMMFPMAFGLYGVAFYATATAGRVGWLRYFAFVAFVFSGLSIYFMGTPEQHLVGAIGSVAVALAPGAMLMRAEPSEVV